MRLIRLRLIRPLFFFVVAAFATIPISSQEHIVASEATVAEIQAFFGYLLEKSQQQAAPTAPATLSEGAKLLVFFAGGFHEGLDDQLSASDRNTLANEVTKYVAALTEIGAFQDSEICLEVSGKEASDVDLERINQVQLEADAAVVALGEESYQRTLERLSREGRALVEIHVSQIASSHSSVATREAMDLAALTAHKNAAVYLAQQKCLEASIREETG